MACRLIGAKPLSEPKLPYCQLDPWEQISVKYKWAHGNKFQWNINQNKTTSCTKVIWKCRLQNGGNLLRPHCDNAIATLLIHWGRVTHICVSTPECKYSMSSISRNIVLSLYSSPVWAKCVISYVQNHVRLIPVAPAVAKLHIYYCTVWQGSVFDQVAVGCRPPWFRHICLCIEYRPRNMHGNMWVRQCVSSWWPLVGFRY